MNVSKYFVYITGMLLVSPSVDAQPPVLKKYFKTSLSERIQESLPVVYRKNEEAKIFGEFCRRLVKAKLLTDIALGKISINTSECHEIDRPFRLNSFEIVFPLFQEFSGAVIDKVAHQYKKQTNQDFSGQLLCKMLSDLEKINDQESWELFMIQGTLEDHAKSTLKDLTERDN